MGIKWHDNTLADVSVQLNGNVVASHADLQQRAGSQVRGVEWDFAIEFNMAAA